MYDSVKNAVVAFNSRFEGVCKNPYLDVKNLITTAIGCLADPVSLALPMPWMMPDGTPASQAEIARQWQALKSQPMLSHYPALSKTVLGATTMRLTDEGVLQIVSQRMLANEKILQSYFPNWSSLPADGMLGILRMRWALGAGFAHTFGNFRSAVNAQNWTGAIASCDIQATGNPGILPRTAANKLCFANAAAAIAQNLPLDVLHWPNATPNASQRDQALRQEAELALANMPALNLSHDADSAAAFFGDEPKTNPTGPAQS